jgi:ABC-type transporter Mla MlaB component
MEPPKKQIGRPLKFPGEKLEQRSIRLTASQWAKVDAAGLAALRKLIDRWRPK